MIDPPVLVQTVESEQWITEGREIIQRHGRDNWRLGELASNLHAEGQTDQQIADSWECSRGQVNQCRLVWGMFGETAVSLTSEDERAFKDRISWRNWREMLTWEDADHCICWAIDTGEGFRGMVAFRNPDPKSGDKLTTDTAESLTGSTGTDPVKDVGTIADPVSFPQATEPHSAIVTPHDPPPAAQEPKSTLPPAVDMRAFVKAVRSIAKTASDADNKVTGRALRKLANEIDPQQPRSAFVPPTREEVAEYCTERGKGTDPDDLIDWALANGWRLSNGNQMRDWRAVVRTFEKREQKGTNNGSVRTTRPSGQPTTDQSIRNLAAAAQRISQGTGSPLFDEAPSDVLQRGIGMLDADPGDVPY